MLKNNCQCELCRSVWEGGGYMKNVELCADDEERVEVEEGPVPAEGVRPITKRVPVVGSGLATQVVTLILLICGFVFIAGKLPDGMWYTWPGAVLLAALSALPVARVGVMILNALEALYENN